MRFSVILFSLILVVSIGTPTHGYGQELSIRVALAINSDSVSEYEFGLDYQALPGIDALDVPEPPCAPNAPAYAYLSMRQPPAELPNRWKKDFRTFPDPGVSILEIWDLTIATSDPAGYAVMAVDAVSAPDQRYRLSFLGPTGFIEGIVPPVVISVPVAGSEFTCSWLLEVDGPISATSSTWGGIKSLYR